MGYSKRLCTHTTSRVQHWGLKTIDVHTHYFRVQTHGLKSIHLNMLLQDSKFGTKDDLIIHATSGLTLGTKVDSSKHATSGFNIWD